MNDIDLIRKIAWSFHRSTGHDWDDLFQEASKYYLELMKTYDPSKGKITTHVYGSIINALRSYIEKERRWTDRTCDLKEAQHKTRSYSYFWESIPNDIRDEVEVLLRNSEILTPRLQKSRMTGEIVSVPVERRLRKLLHENKFKPECILQTINFLKCAFS